MAETEAVITPGPWRWELSMASRRLQLVGGNPRFDLTLLEFGRWGMSGACAWFREPIPEHLNIMHRADRWAKPLPGREHHADWFQILDHPDARLIEAAPELYEALKVTLRELSHCADQLEALRTPFRSGEAVRNAIDAARSAIARVKGGHNG